MSGELSYRFAQDETYISLGFFIIKELLGFKKLLVL